jgi:hypothetical protein
MALYSSVNQGMYGHLARVQGGGAGPQYIPRLHVTEDYIPLYSSVRRNREI